MGTPSAVYAAEEAKRAEAFRRLTGGVAPGAQLHVLAVGVGDYGAAARHLRPRLGRRGRRRRRGGAGRARSDWPYRPGYRDDAARRGGARRSRSCDQLDNIRRRMEVAPGGSDLAVFMFSGHGVVLGEGEAAEFYLLPHGADVASHSRNQGAAASPGPTCGAARRRSPASGGCWCCSTPAAPARRWPTGGRSGRAPRACALSLAGKNVTVLASSGGDRGLARERRVAQRRLHRGAAGGARQGRRHRRQRHDQRRRACRLCRAPAASAHRRDAGAEQSRRASTATSSPAAL